MAFNEAQLLIAQARNEADNPAFKVSFRQFVSRRKANLMPRRLISQCESVGLPAVYKNQLTRQVRMHWTETNAKPSWPRNLVAAMLDVQAQGSAI